MSTPYDFPPRSAFPSSAPRYPNMWFHVARDLAEELDVGISRDGGRPRTSSFDTARWLVFRGLEQVLGVRDDYGYFHNAEGCDAVARVANLDHHVDPQHPERSHGHQLHIRYYTQPFKRVAGGSFTSAGPDGSPCEYYRFAASVHYEVETGHPLHASVDWCPTCGRVGEYAVEGGMCEVVHDPLGLEYLLNGTIRGRRIKDGMGVSYPGLRGLGNDFNLRVVEYERPPAADINTARLALAFFEGSRDSS